MILRTAVAVAALVLAPALASCGGGETTVIQQPAETTAETTTTTVSSGGDGAEPAGEAPDVVGERLDIAKQKLGDVGYKARVSGGGTFGVIVESNWLVCDQQPPDGDTVDINVDRSC